MIFFLYLNQFPNLNVMAALHKTILEVSLQAAISSIEIYNKPDFKYREQTFSILLINAWELLLKAKIIKDNSDELESIYIKKKDGKYKLSRSGNPMTIEVMGALEKCQIDQKIKKNLEKLIEIRDTSVHFYHDTSLSYLVYILGLAALRNYQLFVKEWFQKSLREYNFYIMPLGFSYNFESLNLIELDKKPESLSRLITSVSEDQVNNSLESGYNFTCEIKTTLVSAKKITTDADIVAKVEKESSNNSVIVERLQRLTDKYPLSYTELVQKIKEKRPHSRQHVINSIIKEFKLKEDRKYSSFSFRTKKQREEYERNNILPKGITSIYNNDALSFIVEHLQ